MKPRKTIKSFIRRSRNLSPAKQKLFDEMWLQYGLKISSGIISPEKIFGRTALLILEIGFGSGDTLLSSALKHEENNYIGIEVHEPGVAHFLANASKNKITNVRLYMDDAVIVLDECIPDGILDQVSIFFPDPWPKKRHHKRRLIQNSFVTLLQKKLKPGGVVHIATDWEDYANHILKTFEQNKSFTKLSDEAHIFSTERAPTKFEARGKIKGHKIFDLVHAVKSI